jgi:hypothetical protein
MPIIASLTIILSYLFVWRPWQTAKQIRLESDLHEKFEAFKLIAVRRYYKSLNKLSFEEIEEKYNVDEIYHMIGRV